jgi:hypothetical protein
MRRLAIVVALLLSVATAGTAQAIVPGNTTFTVFTQVRGHGYSGVISLTKRVDDSSAKLTVDIHGMRAHRLVTVWARSGSCAHDRFGVVRVQWISSFRGGHWKATFALTRLMLARWNRALASGNVHFTFSQGGPTLCGNGEAV